MVRLQPLGVIEVLSNRMRYNRDPQKLKMTGLTPGKVRLHQLYPGLGARGDEDGAPFPGCGTGDDHGQPGGILRPSAGRGIGAV